MFYYLGRKKRLAKLYPEPEHDTIIEPFAGSAAYSLHGDRWKRQVVINDLSPIACMVWRWLLQASEKDVKALPEPPRGARLSAISGLSDAERWLIAFHINPGANQRSDVVTAFNRWSAGKHYIAANIHKIKHWKLVEGEYLALPDAKATWFVDPPYQRSGVHYMTNTVDHAKLKEWCLARDGQVIVCEQAGADWLPFRALADIAICGKSRSSESVWTNATRLKV